MKRTFANALALSLLAGLTVFLFWRAWMTWDRLYDDAYITLTYSKNLAAGRGFIFNAPPATLGTTTPLFALAAALGGWVLAPADVSHVAVMLSAAFLAGASWLLVLFRRSLQLSLGQACILGSLWLNSRFPFLGSEMTLFLLLLVLSICLCSVHRYFLAGLAAGLLFLTRGEGALLGPILVLWIFLQSPPWATNTLLPKVRRSALLTLGFFLPVLAWAAYALPIFGMMLPNTMHAKMKEGRLPDLHLFQHALWEAMWNEWGGPMLFFPGQQLIYWVLAFAGIFAALWRPAWRILMLWVAAYVFAYSLLMLPGGAWWYRSMPYFLWITLIGFGVAAVWRVQMGRWYLAAPVRLGAIFLTLITVGSSALVEMSVAREPERDARASSYLAVADWLNENAKPFSTVAAYEVGYLGYFTDFEIIDLAGLTRPDLLPTLDISWEDESVFARLAPNYYMYYPNERLDLVPQQRRIGGFLYRRVLLIPAPQPFLKNFALFEREEGRPPEPTESGLVAALLRE